MSNETKNNKDNQKSDEHIINFILIHKALQLGC